MTPHGGGGSRWRRRTSSPSPAHNGAAAGLLLPGDRVLLVFLPSLDFIVAFLGCIQAGLVPVPVFPPDPRRLRKDLYMFASIQASSGAQVALTHKAYNHLRKASPAAARGGRAIDGDNSSRGFILACFAHTQSPNKQILFPLGRGHRPPLQSRRLRARLARGVGMGAPRKPGAARLPHRHVYAASPRRRPFGPVLPAVHFGLHLGAQGRGHHAWKPHAQPLHHHPRARHVPRHRRGR